MEIVVVLCLAGSALIHLIPLLGLRGPSHVARLYDVAVPGADLALLLVHRAVLFGLLGAALIAALALPEIRTVVIGAVLVSDVAFLVIARLNPGINDALKRVVRADIVSIALLLTAGVLVLAGPT